LDAASASSTNASLASIPNPGQVKAGDGTGHRVESTTKVVSLSSRTWYNRVSFGCNQSVCSYAGRGQRIIVMKGERKMSEQNKAIVRRLYEEIWDKGNLAVLDELHAVDAVDHNRPPGLPPGREGVKQFFRMYLAAFPDVRMVIEDQVAEGDRVVTRWTATGTHKGELMGIPPTGKQVRVSGIDINRLEGGKIIESWGSSDQLGMMQQLGVIPS
jgi:steroid delta-isomerase-like uncharacterized protein